MKISMRNRGVERPMAHTVTYSEALNEALREEMDRDEDVFVVGEDLGDYGGLFRVTKGLQQEFGKLRVVDTPISENGIIGFGVGSAIVGLRPVAEILYIDFMTLAMDQVVNQAAKYRYMTGNRAHVPLVIRTQGGTGRRNAAQHSQSLESWFVHVPGLKVLMPSNPADAKGLLKSAIRDNDPVLFIEHKNLYFKRGKVADGEHLVPIGRAATVREGRDVTLVATSWMVERSMTAAEDMQCEGISVEVIDPRTLKPLDVDAIVDSVRKTKRAVIVHEACKMAGYGAELASCIMEEAFDHLSAPVIRVGGADVPIPYAEPLENASIPQVQDIVQAVRTAFNYKKH
jgi:pyruvate/2-oxoglutarate/acetoin dehydrogenase E1 component